MILETPAGRRVGMRVAGLLHPDAGPGGRMPGDGATPPVARSAPEHRRRSARGFTLVEIMVAMTIVLLLAAMVTPMVITAVKREKEQSLRTALRQIRQAIDDYKQAGDEGRIERKPGESGYPASLSVLVLGVPDRLDPKGRRLYFLRRLPRDPFAADDRRAADETWGKRSYESAPDDPRPGEDIYDVHSLSEGVGTNGVPYKQW